MIKARFYILLALLLGACSAEPPATPDAASVAQPGSAAIVADTTALARIGMVFTDSDPWMAGAVLERGKVRVGDRLFLLSRDNQRVPVEITAIRDDDTHSEVTEATAPRGVFLSFRPESVHAEVDVEAESLLVGDSTLLDYTRAVSTFGATSRD